MKNRRLEAGLAAAVAMGLSAGAVLALAGTWPAKAASAAKADCFSALAQPGGSARLVCRHEAWMTDEERTNVQNMTRGYLVDARCTVAVDIDRRVVDEALVASDRAFAFPAQPVTCQLQTTAGPMTITGTFAPNVVFKDGFAVAASPGLGNITGVNSYLAWPVVAYINNAPAITGEMAAMINAYRAHAGQRQAAR